MEKSYLVFDKGLAEITIYYIKGSLSLGSTPDNDICVKDPEISEHHAVLYLKKQELFIEKLKESTGVFVNDEQITRARLFNEDKIRCGNSNFKIVRIEVPDKLSDQYQDDVQAENQDLPFLCHSSQTRLWLRLNEVIPQVPIFADLEKETIDEVINNARLIVIDSGKTILREGDKGKSLYVILSGKVQVYIFDKNNQIHPVATLSRNEIFGEMSFLTSAPRLATIEAIENTVLCQFNQEVMQKLIYKWPKIKERLHAFHKKRLENTRKQKKEVGLPERRKTPRFNLTLPVSFTISVFDAMNVSYRLRDKVFRLLSKDISEKGLRLRAKDRDLVKVPEGCRVQIEITLPRPWNPIKCKGTHVNLTEKQKGQPYGYFGIEFDELKLHEKEELKQFLFG